MVAFIKYLLFFIAVYFTFYSAYWLLLSVTACFKRKNKKTNKSPLIGQEYLILVPAYKPNFQLIKVLECISRLKSDCKLNVFILFQEANQEIVKKVKAEFNYFIKEKSFKDVKGNPYHHALKYCLKEIKSLIREKEINPSHIILLDKDNLIKEDFLSQIQSFINNGYDIIQGKRLPLSSNTISERYDAIAEASNDTLYRKAKSFLGLSPEISGSATAYTFTVFSFLIDRLDFKAPGLDKLLMVSLLTAHRNFKIAYQEKAIVYEEKTASLEGLENQRKRWFAEQYYNALYNGLKLIKAAVIKWQWSPIDYFITLWRPPRSFHILISIIFMFIYEIFNITINYQNDLLILFGVNFYLLILAISISILESGFWKEALKTASYLPLFAIRNLKASVLGFSKKNEGKFIHTIHEIGNQD